jgi:peptidoglycan/xylan/chitin deacetylase (PgdA/CDA1 family)
MNHRPLFRGRADRDPHIPATAKAPTGKAPTTKAATKWTAAGSVAAVVASFIGGAVFAAPAHAADPPVITLTYDDANGDQVAAAQILNAAGLKGTFYTPSGYLDAAGYMTKAQALALQAAGNEIAGHTVTHPDLAQMGADEVKRQICNDRVNLTNMGFRITSFAYPFASLTPAVEQTVKDCGFNSARGLGDLESKVAGTAGLGFAETIPPADPWLTKAPDEVDNTWTLLDLQNLVTKAEPGGGWVQITFHHIGAGTDATTGIADPLTISTDVYTQFITWLAAQQSAGTISVKTVDQVIGGTVQPPVAGPAAPAPLTTGNLFQNPSLETAGPVATGLPQCWAAGGFGTNTRTFTTVTPGHTGTAAEQMVMSAYTNGDGKLLPTLDLGECAPSAIPGHTYTMKAWYQSTAPTQFELYYRTGLGTWNYWTASPQVPAATAWTQTTWTSPAVPAGASAISMGLNLVSAGTLTTDDYELTDGAATDTAAATTAITAVATTSGIGTATGTVVCGLTAGGCYQNYTGGVIHWTATTGAFVTKGAIDAAWAAQGWETGPIGYPTSNEIGGLKNGGVYQNFQHGVIHWSPATGAHITKGAIDAAWAAQNWENGGLGYPTSNEIGNLKNGGVYQTFQGGVIHWSPATGAHITKAAIDAAWAGLNWENGFLGYPTSNEITGLKNGGVYQNFQGGVIYWSAGSGAHANAGAIRTAYASQGWENGRLGYPITNEFASGAGVAQDYQGGRITWSAAAGAAITYK